MVELTRFAAFPAPAGEDQHRKETRDRVSAESDSASWLPGAFPTTRPSSNASALTRKGSVISQRGASLLMVLAGLALAGVSWSIYVELRRGFWDAKVKELCAKDGGTKVFERTALTDRRYLEADGTIRIPTKLDASPGHRPGTGEAKLDDLYYTRLQHTLIRNDDPRVGREDLKVVRAGDGKLLGQATSFVRVGGDLVALDFESRFRCPEISESAFFSEIFIVNAGGVK